MGRPHYSERGDLCRECGFGSFPDYLKSATWEEIRVRLEAHHGNACSLCGSVSARWIHTAYSQEILLGEGDAAERVVFPICLACARKVEFDGNNHKRTLKGTLSIFRQLREAFTSLTPAAHEKKAKDAKLLANALKRARRAERLIKKERRISEAKKRLPRL